MIKYKGCNRTSSQLESILPQQKLMGMLHQKNLCGVQRQI